VSRERRHGNFWTLDPPAPPRRLGSDWRRGRERVFEFFAKLAEATDGSFALTDRDLTESHEHSVALVRVEAERGGRRLDANAGEVVRWRNGQIAEEWAIYGDQYAADEFFSS
jgi:ketosteroid isomerase-like protein